MRFRTLRLRNVEGQGLDCNKSDNHNITTTTTTKITTTTATTATTATPTTSTSNSENQKGENNKNNLNLQHHTKRYIDIQRTTHNIQHTANNEQPTTHNEQQTKYNIQHAKNKAGGGSRRGTAVEPEIFIRVSSIVIQINVVASHVLGWVIF